MSRTFEDIKKDLYRVFYAHDIICIVGSLSKNKDLETVHDIDLMVISSKPLEELEIEERKRLSIELNKLIDLFYFSQEEAIKRLRYRDYFIWSLIKGLECIKGQNILDKILADQSFEPKKEEIILFNLAEMLYSIDTSVNIFDNFKYFLRKYFYLNNFGQTEKDVVLNYMFFVFRNDFPNIKSENSVSSEKELLYISLSYAHLSLGYLLYILGLIRYNSYFLYDDLIDKNFKYFSKEVSLFREVRDYKLKIKNTKEINVEETRKYISKIYRVINKNKKEILEALENNKDKNRL